MVLLKPLISPLRTIGQIFDGPKSRIPCRVRVKPQPQKRK